MKIIIYILLLSLPFISYGPYILEDNGQRNSVGQRLNDNVPGKTMVLHDFATRRDYVLDCTHTLLCAYDFNGNLVWATDPWKDNNIREYRTKRPFIIDISFVHLDPSGWIHSDNFRSWNANSTDDYFSTQIGKGIRVLNISYNNSQWGWINLENGKYFFAGQD